MATAIDVRAMADHIELSMRWFFASLFIPEQPDAFWDDLAAGLTADLSEHATIWLNACAVMADASQLANLTEES